MDNFNCSYCYDGIDAQIFDIPYGCQNGDTVVLICRDCLSNLGAMVVTQILNDQTSQCNTAPTWIDFTSYIERY